MPVQKSKRFYYLDLLKLIATFCVCSYHFAFLGNLDYIDGVSNKILVTRLLFNINSICIPLFFMVNGSLLLNKTLKIKGFIKKSAVILLQYYFWRFLTIVLLADIKDIDLSNIGKSNLFNAVFLWSDINGIDLAHLWFIPSLLCVYFIYPFIKHAFDQLNYQRNVETLFLYSLLVLFTICFLFNDLSTISKSVPIISNINFLNIKMLNPFRSIVGALLLYFILGGLIHKNIDTLKNIKTYKLIICFIIAAFLLLGKWYIESKAENATWDGVFGGYASTPTLIMTSCIFILAAKIPNSFFEKSKSKLKMLVMVGKNTLNVYYMHWIFGYAVLMRYYPYFRTHTGVLVNAVKSIVVVMLFSFAGALLKKIPVIWKLLH